MKFTLYSHVTHGGKTYGPGLYDIKNQDLIEHLKGLNSKYPNDVHVGEPKDKTAHDALLLKIRPVEIAEEQQAAEDEVTEENKADLVPIEETEFYQEAMRDPEYQAYAADEEARLDAVIEDKIKKHNKKKGKN